LRKLSFRTLHLGLAKIRITSWEVDPWMASSSLWRSGREDGLVKATHLRFLKNQYGSNC
jgi:hypothetical protein